MRKINSYLTLLIILTLFLGGCSSLTIEIEDISVVTSDPGSMYEKRLYGMEINLIGTLRLNFKSNIDLINYTEENHLHLSARIYVCNDKQREVYGFVRIYQNYEKETNKDNDEYYFTLFHSFIRGVPNAERSGRYNLTTKPREQLCFYVSSATMFWMPYNLESTPVVIDKQLLDQALERHLDKGEKEAQLD
jgi:hypothetical protein